MNASQKESLEWLLINEPLETDHIDLEIEVMKDHPIAWNEYVPYALAITCDNDHSVDVAMSLFNSHLLKWLGMVSHYQSVIVGINSDESQTNHAIKCISCINEVSDMYDGYHHEFIGRSLYIYDTSTSFSD